MENIKFRGWDGAKLLPAQDLSQSSKYWTWLGKKDVILQQFTWLLDNNWVEVHEGDIVKMDDEAIIKPNKILQVIHDGFCTFYLAEYDYYIAPLSDGVNDRLWNYKQKHGLAGEVIGNIFQNPGLLN